MKFAKALSLLCFALLLAFSARGQSPEFDKYRQNPIFLKKTNQTIVLDGNVDEPAWFEGQGANNYWEYRPSDTMQTQYQTELYMTFDDEFLYIAAICHAPGNKFVTHSYRRDYQSSGNDHIAFVIDPFNDNTNAFLFGITPYGVTREGLISGGGRNFQRGWDISWDNKWNGVAKIHDNFWTAELAIPFTTLRFSEGSSEWNFNSYRMDTQSSTQSSWTRIPTNQLPLNLGYMGKMIWEEPLKKPGANMSVIPYISAGGLKNHEEGTDQVNNLGFGGDVKIGVSSGLNLDLTVNPDFSQVEVDQQQTNLGRFELFFPERRQFFLENADLFSGFGDSRINPFFSRRIGIKSGESIPIYGGARLSGKINDNWRIGILNMQTASKDDFSDEETSYEPSYNYTVAALQRKIFAQSNVGLIFVNKQTFENLEDYTDITTFNRVIGVDYNLASADNRWTGKAFAHREIKETYEEDDKMPFAHGFNLAYRIREFSAEWEHQWVSSDYSPDVGFVPRNDFYRISPRAEWFFYPKNPKIVNLNPEVSARIFWNPELGKTDHEYQASFSIQYTNESRLNFSFSNEYTYLFEDFNPTRLGEEYLPADTDYTYSSGSISYNSDRRKPWQIQMRAEYGQFYNGTKLTLNGSLSFRKQPYVSIAMNYNYNHIEMPMPFIPTDLILLGPRIDLTFTKNLFWTTFFQYNKQVDNINLNTRVQWRFAPVSDFFLVYTDNYFANDFMIRNRALVAKLTYWLNI